MGPVIAHSDRLGPPLPTDGFRQPGGSSQDRMGLAWAPVRPPARDIARWYAYATRDDYVRADELPYRFGARDPHDVVAAVSSLTRRPTARLRQRGPERTLLVASLRWLAPYYASTLGERRALDPAWVLRTRIRRGLGHASQDVLFRWCRASRAAAGLSQASGTARRTLIVVGRYIL